MVKSLFPGALALALAACASLGSKEPILVMESREFT